MMSRPLSSAPRKKRPCQVGPIGTPLGATTSLVFPPTSRLLFEGGRALERELGCRLRGQASTPPWEPTPGGRAPGRPPVRTRSLLQAEERPVVLVDHVDSRATREVHPVGEERR